MRICRKDLDLRNYWIRTKVLVDIVEKCDKLIFNEHTRV